MEPYLSRQTKTFVYSKKPDFSEKSGFLNTRKLLLAYLKQPHLQNFYTIIRFFSKKTLPQSAEKYSGIRIRQQDGCMTVTIADIMGIMEELAPSQLAEDWDNPGLQVGQKDWSAEKIRIALDPLPEVVWDACADNTNLLITHHPLIFKPLQSIDFSTPSGSVIHMAARHHMGIFSAHTNLDSTSGGVNDMLSACIGLKDRKVLGNEISEKTCKLVVYVPAEYEDRIFNALSETPAGRIGRYSCCSFRNPGTGTFRPEPGAKPFSGKIGEILHASEVRIESVVREQDAAKVVKHIRAHHPYETMAYDLYPLSGEKSGHGPGRTGLLDQEISLKDFAMKIRQIFGLTTVKFCGRPDLRVRKVAVCSGSGSGMMRDFLASSAQVFVSGDLRYHDARDAESDGRGLIDIGHFASEHLIVAILAERMRAILTERNMPVTVEICKSERDPFVYLQS